LVMLSCISFLMPFLLMITMAMIMDTPTLMHIHTQNPRDMAIITAMTWVLDCGSWVVLLHS
jgi:hypothetical protein